MRLVFCLLLTALFLSCVESSKLSLEVQDETLSIKDIVSHWADIEQLFTATYSSADEPEVLIKTLADTSNDFYLSLKKFQESYLYQTYRAIPFAQETERSLRLHLSAEIQEVELVTDLALIFCNSIASGDMENAKLVSAEISSILIRLLLIDKETQRFIGSSYFNLLFTLIIFIVIITLLIWFLYQSLTRSLKREAEGTIFSHTYMLAQDEERTRISRELHDTIIQDMRYLLLETEKIGNTDDKNEREILSGKTIPLMADLIRKTRDMCNNLIPPDFRFSELPDALRQLCIDFGNKTGIDCRAEIDGNIKLDFLTMEKRLQVFRIVQEALSNIEKHSQAKEAIVTMRYGQNGIVYIGIGDDGKGFNSPLDNKGQIISGIDKSHIGIISMKERAVILGGSLKIESEIGEGALICLEIPAKEVSNGSIIN